MSFTDGITIFPLYISVQIVAILKKKGKKDHDIFISIVNKLEHTEVPCLVFSCKSFPLQGKATNLNFLATRFTIL